ncbi:MAG: 30S ribosomal protein S19e [Candidatus Pacearchaeota archaeon]
MAKTIYSKDPEKFIANLAQSLKTMEEFNAPKWSFFIKSGTSRERPPVSSDFWQIRAASILRQLYIKGVVGVGKLRTKYGSRKDRGGMPAEFRKSGGKIIRTILQQAETAGLVEKVNKFQHGRRLTEKGKALLDSINTEEKSNINFEEVRIKNLHEYAEQEQETEESESEESE